MLICESLGPTSISLSTTILPSIAWILGPAAAEARIYKRTLQGVSPRKRAIERMTNKTPKLRDTHTKIQQRKRIRKGRMCVGAGGWERKKRVVHKQTNKHKKGQGKQKSKKRQHHKTRRDKHCCRQHTARKTQMNFMSRGPIAAWRRRPLPQEKC